MISSSDNGKAVVPQEPIACPEAEQLVVGCLACEPWQIAQVKAMLAPAHFTLPVWRTLYEAILKLEREGKADVGRILELVLFDLRRADKLDALGGFCSLSEAMDEAGPGLDGVGLAREILRCAQQRKWIDTAEALKGAGDLPAKEELLKGALSSVRALEPRDAHDDGASVWAEMENLFLGGGEPQGPPIKTHTRLDGHVHRLAPGYITTLAARTSMGKSVFAEQTAFRNAQAGIPSVVFSLEMPRATVQARLACAWSSIDTRRVINERGQRMRATELDRFYEARVALTKLPLYFPAVKRGTPLAEIEAAAERYVREQGVRFIVIDHLRLVNAGGKNIFERQTNASDGLSRLAAQLEIPILVVVQINREGGKADRPAIHHLEGSGAIEQDSETIILLHGSAPDSGADRSEMEAIVGKSRDGRTGKCILHFEPQFSRFDHDYWLQALKARGQTNLL